MFEPITNGAALQGGWPLAMAVRGLEEALRDGSAAAATHVLALQGPGSRGSVIAGLDPGRALTLVCDDVIDPAAANAPQPQMLDAVCAFADALPPDARLLIHCRQGIGRSPAIALGLLARVLSPERAGEALHRIRPFAGPNELIVAFWDRRLRLRGALRRVGWRFPCERWRSRAPHDASIELRPRGRA